RVSAERTDSVFYRLPATVAKKRHKTRLTFTSAPRISPAVDRREVRSQVTLIRHGAGFAPAPALSVSMVDVRMTGHKRTIAMTKNFDTASDCTDVVDVAWAE